MSHAAAGGAALPQERRLVTEIPGPESLARLDDIRNQREFQALQRETEGQKRATRDAETKLQELHRTQDELDRHDQPCGRPRPAR